MNALAQQVKDLGFRVFVRNDGDTYAFFTNGKSFGYVQKDYFGGYSISSVHIPNHTSGTGFQISKPDELTAENLSSAFCIAPYWADWRSQTSVKQYANEKAFLKAHSWGGGLKEV